jgi:hypothetical protein
VAGIVLKASVNIRTRTSRFPAGSFAAALSPARASLVRDVQRAFATRADPVSGFPWPSRSGSYPWPALDKTGVMKREAIQAAASAVITGSSITATMKAPKYAGFQQKGTKTISPRRFLGASIGTIRIVQAGLVREGRAHAVRVLRGKA